jgi:hypothetical protein
LHYVTRLTSAWSCCLSPLSTKISGVYRGAWQERMIFFFN